jgi:hypothetical protein
MASAVVAAVAVVLILVALAIVVRRVAGSQHTFDAALRQLDADMQVFTRRVGHVVERASEARDRGVRELELVFDLDALLLRVAASAAVRTDAEAAAVRVQGAGPAPVARSFGAEEVGTLLEGTLHPPGEGQFRALTVNWTLGASFDRDAAAFRSALVVPILEEGLETSRARAGSRSSRCACPVLATP